MALNLNSLSYPPGFPPKPSHGRPTLIPNDNNDHSSMDINQFPFNENSNSNSRHLLLPDEPTEPLHQNHEFMNILSQRGHQLSPNDRHGHGQLALRKRMANSPSPSLSSAPRRVRVNSVIDCNPVPNQPGVNEVTVTEVKKTRFLSPTSTEDRLVAPAEAQDLGFPFPNQLIMNHSFNQNEEPVHDFYLPYFSQSHSSSIPSKISIETLEPFQNVNYLQNPTQNHNQSNPDNFLDLNADLHPNTMMKTEAIVDPSPMNFAFVAENNNNQNQNPPQEQLNKFVSNTPTRVHQNDCIVISDDEEDGDFGKDGRTHSLLHKKFGPYICPKCKEVFQTSQFFAAHVSAAHYRFETKAQRNRRLAAKFKNKKDFEVVHSSEGITLVPETAGGGGKSMKKKPGRLRKKKEMRGSLEKRRN
ncbi:hypothetical protein Patl1_29889 [Pistacia atlantica]|uniref:Uncharacterized protein n=1 Tax=Pistacia atlantica TaxID=434234 RepID=A0ACC1ABQ4_9ROSI|nr:hypothetical protein Patl1_29889 [Pistacia atlantica]